MTKRKQPNSPGNAPSLRLEWRSPAELAENPRNWRTHPEAQQAALAGVLSEVGWAGACLYNERTGRLIDGHLRRKVAQMQGAETMPVLVGDWSEADEAKILATLDPIAGLAECDPVRLRSVIDDVQTATQEVADMLTRLWEDNKPVDELPPVDEDTPPEPQEAVVTRPSDLWTLGRHRLLCGDCREPQAWERLLGGERVALLMIDPPYGISVDKEMHAKGGQQYGNAAAPKRHYANTNWDTEPPAGEFLLSLVAKADEAVVWGGNYFNLPPARCVLVWDKENGGNAFADCELAWTTFDKPVRIIRHQWNGMIRKDHEERFEHPTQKPIGVIAWAIQHAKEQDGLIVDCYAGSGTTLMACEHLGRRAFLCEIEPAYCDVILRRYIAKHGGDPVRHDGKTWSELTGAK